MGKLADDVTLEEDEINEEIESDEVDEDDDVDDEEEQEEPAQPKLYTEEQVQAAIKMRVNTLNKRNEKMKPYQQAVAKITEVTGLSTSDLLARLSVMSDAEQAKILGLTPQQFAERKTSTPKKEDDETVQLRRDLEEQKLTALPEFKDLALFKDEIYDMMDDNPKLTMKQAYQLVKGELATTAAVRDAEQRAVARMTKSSNQKVVKPGIQPTQTPKKLDPAIVAAAKKVGMDPDEYAAYAKMSTVDDYEKHMKNKKKG